MEKAKTGIMGFDRLVSGGFPTGSTNLIGGAPGTGKTIFALEYIYNGAAKFGEKGLYITIEESIDRLKKQAAQFGWDFDSLEKKGTAKIIHISTESIKENVAENIVSIIKKGGYVRVVVDSISALAINTPNSFGSLTDINEFFIKRFMYIFIRRLAKSGATSLLVSQTTDSSLSSDGVSEFICDGVINIKYESLGGNYSRYLAIRKMREVNHDEDIHPIEIKAGIAVHKLS
ncbi:AAA family ATPase [Candidatus Woesearchaeota archaeon]|nr:AAA family ATPase [Candidatus Woesearchaeota archaeon]